MSYDISLTHPRTNEVLEAPEKHYMQGGSYVLGGTKMLWLNVTYNYGDIYRRPDIFGHHGIHVLDDLTGGESIPLLKKAIDSLKDDDEEDYWKPTEGNARRALINLLKMAQMRPDGIWKVE